MLELQRLVMWGRRRRLPRVQRRRVVHVADVLRNGGQVPVTLQADAGRLAHYRDRNGTGIFVRAQMPDGTWSSVDIVCLTRDSVWHWLSEHGEEFCRNTVMQLLGWG